MGQIIQDDAIESLVYNIYTRMDNMREDEVTEEWFDTLCAISEFSGKLADGFSWLAIIPLAIIKQRWEELPKEIQKRYNFSYMDVALSRFPEWKSPTVRNYVGVAECWVLNNPAPDHLIPVPERVDGKIVVENGKQKVTYKQFNPLEIPISKLIAAKGPLNRGEMDEEAWTLLLDRGVSRDELVTHFYRAQPKRVTYFFLEGGFICLTNGIEEFQLGELYLDDTEEEVQKGIDRILSLLNIERDEDAIHRIESRKYKPDTTGETGY